MFSQIYRSVGRVPRVRKRKSGLGPFNGCLVDPKNVIFEKKKNLVFEKQFK